MISSSNHCDVSGSDTGIALAWTSYYPVLKTFIYRLVLSSRVASWRGQEEDIVNDIMQETAYRLLERHRKAQRGEAAPIHVLEHMATAIAVNYCRDIRRRDHRLTRSFAHCQESDETIGADYESLNIPEAAIEEVYQQALFLTLAREIAQFPKKQRWVLLCDLASHMSFGEQPTGLQAAFLQVGICLQDYQRPLSSDPAQRSKYTALRYYAYKRIAQLPCIRQLTSEVL